jgi:hypothetical protein
MFTFTWQYTPEMYAEAQEAFMRAVPLHRRVRVGLAVIGALVLVTSLCVGVLTGQWRPVLPGIIFATALLLIRFVFIPFSHKRQFRSQPLLANTMRVSVAEERLNVATSVGEGSVSWEAFRYWRESANLVVLIYKGERIFYALPKAELSADDARQLRALIERKLGPQAG